MKTLILSTAVIMGLGAAVPATAQVVIQGPGYSDRGDCRTVEKRVQKNGKTVITRERRCGDRYSDRGYRDGNDRYVERRDNGPGIYIGR